MINIKWNENYGYYLITSADGAILGYIYPNGWLVRPNGKCEEYASQDAAYAAI
jgi:hypothetical protein